MLSTIRNCRTVMVLCRQAGGWCALLGAVVVLADCGSDPFVAAAGGGTPDAAIDVVVDGAGSDSSDESPLLDASPDVSGDVLSDGKLDVAVDVISDALTDASAVEADTCAPKTCEDLGIACGSASNECGGTVVCPACASPSSCVGGKCCAPQAPVATWDATPSGTDSKACGIGSVSTNDGSTGGLACAGAGYGVIDGHNVTACIGADFGATLPINSVVVRAAAAKTACSITCTGADCGSGVPTHLFAGTSKTSLSFVKTFNPTSTMADFSANLAGLERYVVVCRSAFGSTYDQVVIDSILSAAVCQ
jgi:hypothetical protein